MKHRMIKFCRWWQRNFGHVYASPNGRDWYRCRARFGKIALIWGESPFIVRLSPTHHLIILDKWLPAHGRPYGGWKWAYKPYGRLVGHGGFW